MIFKNVTFYNEVFQKDVADIQVENGRITAIGVLEQEGRDMQGYTLLPGFVDIHIHGRGGGDFSDGTVSSMDRISASLAKCGVTAFCGTTMTLPREKLTDIPEKVDFFDALPDYDVEFFTNKKSKTNAEVSKAMLEAAIPALEAVSDWTVDAIHDTLIDLAAKLEVKNATLMWPVRIAAAGKLVTPGGAVEICHLLGREETLRRLRLGLDKLN